MRVGLTAGRVISLAVLLDLLAGTGFAVTEHLSIGEGLYWALSTATTVGYGDITPHTVVGHLLAALVMTTVVPLFAASFSLLTSGLTSIRMVHHTNRLEQRLDHIIRHHPDIPELENQPTEGTRNGASR